MTLAADRKQGAAMIAAVLAGIAVQIAAYWPGIMIWDSIRQYEQALSGDYDDWHPPAMDWLWRQLLTFHAGPAPLFVLQMLLFWGGFGLLAGWAMQQKQRGLAIALLACALLPAGFALIGAMIKDSLMAGALLTATGLMAWSHAYETRAAGERHHSPSRAVAILLVLFAATMRFNAFLAGLPLLVALLPAGWRSTRRRLALTTMIAAVPLVLAVPVANHLLGAERSGVELSLVIYDLGGITEYSGVDMFPPLPVADPVSVNDNCYSHEKWDPYAWWNSEPCPIGFDGIRAWFKKTGQSPYTFWAKAVIAHPLAYAEHRIRHFNSNTFFLVRDGDYDDDNSPAFSQSDPNPWHYYIKPNRVESTIEQIVLGATETPIGWPIFWMAMATGVLILCPLLPSRRIVLPVVLSSLLYGLGYLVVSVASEMRYHFWTMAAAAIVSAIAASDLAKGAAIPRRRLVLAAVPPVLVALLGIGWRLAPFV